MVRRFTITASEMAALVERGFVVQAAFGSRLRLMLDLDTDDGRAQGEALLAIRETCTK